MQQALYFDDAASTPMDPSVVEAMVPWLTRAGNAHARHHAAGMNSSMAVKRAREQVACAIGVEDQNIIFTSGATESNNLAIMGLRDTLRRVGKTHIITSAVEHKSILEPLRYLDGFDVSVLPVKPCGMIEVSAISRAITDRTGLISIQAVNNETGTIQPIDEIRSAIEGRGIFLHVDAAQALGKIKIPTADFITLSAHKIYGPQGIGALYAHDFGLMSPIMHGGGQENGFRAGTVPVALCVGFGAACDVLTDNRDVLQQYREEFLRRIHGLGVVVNGHADPAWNVPGILNLRFPGIDADTLVMALPELCFGVGSACHAGPSHVILAMTGSDQAARESIRLSFGRFTTMDDVIWAAEKIAAVVSNIQKMQEVA